MDVSSVSVCAAAKAACMAKEIQAVNEMQVAIMKSVADSQQQVAELVVAAGLGQNLDVMA